MYAYLMKKRCIDKEVVYALQAQKKIYQDSRRNCVFVAYDNDGKAQYASMRGTLTPSTLAEFTITSDKIGNFKDCIVCRENKAKKVYINGYEYLKCGPYQLDILNSTIQTTTFSAQINSKECMIKSSDDIPHYFKNEGKYTIEKNVPFFIYTTPNNLINNMNDTDIKITYQNYRGDVLNSDKSYGFEIPGRSNRLFVFESPIDAMSHATLTKFMHKDWKEDNRLSLGGLTDLALDRYLKQHPNINQIIFCLDNDYKATHPLTGELQNHGQIATRRMAAKYSKQGYDVKRILPTMPYKDFNEQLVSFVQRQQQQAEEQDIDCEVAACG